MPDPSSSLTALLAAIEARLVAALPDMAVATVPDAGAVTASEHPVGSALLAYGGSIYGEPESLDLVVQERRVTFGVTLLLRGPGGSPSPLDRLDVVRLALTGLRPAAGGAKARPVHDRFVGHDGEVWRFEIVFAVAMPAMEQPEDEPLPLVKRLTFSGPEGTTVISKEIP